MVDFAKYKMPIIIGGVVMVLIIVAIVAYTSMSGGADKEGASTGSAGTVEVPGGAQVEGAAVLASDSDTVAASDSDTAAASDSDTAAGDATSDPLVYSIELQEVPPHGTYDSVGGDGIMNINEIQLWQLASDGTLTNVARSGTATLEQGTADKYFAALGGIGSVNNGKVGGKTKGFQFTTIPVSEAPIVNYNAHDYPPNPYPIVRITLADPVPLSELVSTVIFNRTDGSQQRLGQDHVVLKDASGGVVSKVQLPAVTVDYVRVDYKHADTFSQHMTTDMAQANTKIINLNNNMLVKTA